MVTVVHEAAAIGYSVDADRYHRGRPSYHPDLAKRVVSRYGRGRLVELGAGTGIFTRQLIDHGAAVIAVEPVISMRTTLFDVVPEANIRVGSAEQIPLTDDSVDTIVASQSFHWFDFGPALDEIYRVLHTGGHLVTVWNVRDESVDWVSRYSTVVDRFSGSTPRYRTMSWRRAINDDPRFAPVDEWRMPNPYPTDAAGAVDRALSTSFIAALPPQLQHDVAEKIGDIVEPLGQRFDFPYMSQLQAWRSVPSPAG